MSADFPFEPCAQCGVRSYVFLELQSGGQLSYCGSHYRTNEEALKPKIRHLIDMRDRILE